MSRMSTILTTMVVVHVVFTVSMSDGLTEYNVTSNNSTVRLCTIYERMCNDGFCDSIFADCSGHGGSKCRVNEKFCPGIGCVYKSFHEQRGCHYGTCSVCTGGSCSDDGVCPGARCGIGKKLCADGVCYFDTNECPCTDEYSADARHCPDASGCYEKADQCDSFCDCTDCSDESCGSNFFEMIGGNLHIVFICLSLLTVVVLPIIAVRRVHKKRQADKAFVDNYSASLTNGQTQQLLSPRSDHALNPLHTSPRAVPRIWEANPDHLFSYTTSHHTEDSTTPTLQDCTTSHHTEGSTTPTLQDYTTHTDQDNATHTHQGRTTHTNQEFTTHTHQEEDLASDAVTVLSPLPRPTRTEPDSPILLTTLNSIDGVKVTSPV